MSPVTSGILSSLSLPLQVSSPFSSPFLHVLALILSVSCPPSHSQLSWKKETQANPAPGFHLLSFLNLKEMESLLHLYAIQAGNRLIIVQSLWPLGWGTLSVQTWVRCAHSGGWDTVIGSQSRRTTCSKRDAWSGRLLLNTREGT